jgi:hypothetical protein
MFHSVYPATALAPNVSVVLFVASLPCELHLVCEAKRLFASIPCMCFLEAMMASTA